VVSGSPEVASPPAPSPRSWRRSRATSRVEVEPTLEREWQEAAGRSNTRILVTAGELVDLEAAIEQLLAPYVLRHDAEIPVPGARGVRILRHTMPEATP